MVIVKFAVVEPLGTVTVEGTVAADVLLASATVAPPDGAATFSVTVPVAFVDPPVRDEGLIETEFTRNGVTVSVAVLVPLNVPVMVTLVELETAFDVIVKFAVVEPAGTVTVLGTVATSVLLLASPTTNPPAGAAVFSVTVPFEFATVPVTDDGLNDTELITIG